MDASIEVVRGNLGPDRAEELRAFWSGRGALTEDEAEQRLPEVVCVLRTDGGLVGSCSVYPAEMPLIGGRRFWIYRSLIDEEATDRASEMIAATFRTLEAEFDSAPDTPLGLCVLIADPAERQRRPEAEWSDPQMVYAGYLADGRQVRVGYFDGAVIHHDG